MINELNKGIQQVTPQASSQGAKPSVDVAKPTQTNVVDMLSSGSAVVSTKQQVEKQQVQSEKVPEKMQEKAEELAQDLQSYSQQFNRSIQFNVNDDTGNVIINVIDADTNETIRQIPSEEMQELQMRLSDIMDSMEESGDIAAKSIFINSTA